MLYCEQLQSQLNDFMDGTLDAVHSVALNAHLVECADCRREFNAMRATQALLRADRVPDGRQAQRQALAALRRVPTAPATISRKRLYWHGAIASAGLAAAILLIICENTMPPRLAEPVATPIIVTSLASDGLPTPGELDEMTSLHAAQSVAVAPGDDSIQQATLADANSRLRTRKN